MSVGEILVVIAAIAFVVIIFGNRIYRIINHKPTDECQECHNSMKRAVKRMRKKALREKRKNAKKGI